MTARSHTDGSRTSFGFKLSVIFTKLPTEILSITGLNGVMNSSQFTYHDTSLSPGCRGWNLSIELFFDEANRCPGNSSIRAKIDTLPEINVCNGVNKFYGESISIIEFKDVKSSLSVIHYKSFRYRGFKKCNPDFDYGNKIRVPMETICDGIYDCDNDADEENCEPMNSNEINPEYSYMTIILVSTTEVLTIEVSTTETPTTSTVAKLL